MASSHWPTWAVVSVTHFLLSAGACTLSAAALRGGVITQTCPHLNPASTVGGAFWPGSPLAPAAVDRATRKWVTVQDTCFTCTRKITEKQLLICVSAYLPSLTKQVTYTCNMIPVMTVSDDGLSWICMLPVWCSRPLPGNIPSVYSSCVIRKTACYFSVYNSLQLYVYLRVHYGVVLSYLNQCCYHQLKLKKY